METFYKKPTGLPYTAFVNRNVARLLAVRLAKVTTPNFVTVLGFSVLVIACVYIFIAAGTLFIVGGYLLLAVSYVLDSVDGQIARIQNSGSLFGEWLDHALDGLRILLINITLLWTISYDDVYVPFWIILTAFSLNIIGMTSTYFFSILKDKIFKIKTGELLSNARGVKVWVMRSVLAPADYGVFIMCTIFLADPRVFAYVYLIYGIYNVLIFIANFIVSVRQCGN